MTRRLWPDIRRRGPVPDDFLCDRLLLALSLQRLRTRTAVRNSFVVALQKHDTTHVYVKPLNGTAKPSSTVETYSLLPPLSGRKVKRVKIFCIKRVTGKICELVGRNL